MQIGANVGAKSVKGGRSFTSLNGKRDKLCFFSTQFEQRFNLKRITDITEDLLIRFFADMKSGVIKKLDGERYISTDTFGRVFKTFWHWWMKVNKKKGIEIPDITVDLDTRQEKPDWVYLTEEEVKQLAESAAYKYKALIWFLYDTGIRAPTELVNVRVSDLYNECKEVNIRQESAKTFGRRIKIMLCSELLKEYIKHFNLKPEDQLFNINGSVANRQLKRLAKKLFKDEASPAGQRYWQLSLYDFRHCSCCYWLPRYKSESALKYRFGWKKSDKIHYYSELLGMKDTIAQEDMLIDTTMTEIEQRLEQSEKEKNVIQERLKTMEMQMATVMEHIKQAELRAYERKNQIVS
jgi:integrase